MTDDLLRLAERCEQARGADRLLDANIHWQIMRSDFEADADYRKAAYCYARSGWTLNKADRLYLSSIPVPFYTASLDAAITLVPEGYMFTLYSDGVAGVAKCQGEDLPDGDINAATPALALCAAALRARAQSGASQ